MDIKKKMLLLSVMVLVMYGTLVTYTAFNSTEKYELGGNAVAWGVSVERRVVKTIQVETMCEWRAALDDLWQMGNVSRIGVEFEAEHPFHLSKSYKQFMLFQTVMFFTVFALMTSFMTLAMRRVTIDRSFHDING